MDAPLCGAHGKRGYTRRGLGRAGLASALVVAGGGAVAAAGRALAAAPGIAAPKIVLTFQPWQYAYGFQSLPALNGILYDATAPFRAANPGITLKFFGPEINPYTSVMTGEGPDVPQLQGGGGGITDWISGALGTLLVDLSPYIRQANVNLNDFSPDNVLDVSYNGGVYGIPNYTGTAAVAVNLSALDDMGLKYPSPNWTYEEWASLSRAASTKLPNGSQRLGATIATSFGSGPDTFYYHGWGANQVDPANSTRSTLDSAPGVACAEFLYQMVFDKVAAWGWVPSNFVQGLTVAPFCWQQTYMIPAATSWTGFKWDFWPQPVWPKQKATMTNYNYFGIAATSKYPDAAWELLYWLTVKPDWQRALMRTTLLSPGYLPLWPEYVTVVRQVAPPLRDKNLQVFPEQVPDAVIHGGRHFANSEVQAQTIISNWYGEINARKISVREGLTQMVRQIDALESVGAKLQATQTATLLAVKRELSSGAALTAPAKTGVGAPPRAPAAGAFTPGPAGAFTLVAGGADVWDPTANCLFAGTSSTARSGEFTCRVTLLANVNCPHLSQWAKVGLMAAGDLSDQAAAVTIELSGENGINQQVQIVPGGGWGATGPSSGSAPTGLIGNQLLTRPNTTKQANYLLRPVWLRLTRQSLQWQSYTSLDGSHWTEAGPVAAVEMGGFWVGLFLTAHNDSFNGTGLVKATLDNVSFQTNTVVQIGTP